MDAVRELLRAASQNGAGLEVDGKPLTSERLKRRIGEVFNEHDMLADEFIVSHGAAERGRARHGLGPDPLGRADRHRPLAARPRDGVLRGHDPHVRRR